MSCGCVYCHSGRNQSLKAYSLSLHHRCNKRNTRTLASLGLISTGCLWLCRSLKENHEQPRFMIPVMASLSEQDFKVCAMN